MNVENAEMLAPENVRFEIVPLVSDSGAVLLPRNLTVIPKESKVAITCSSTLGIGRVLEATQRVLEAGYEPVPHIPARMVKDEAHLLRVMTVLNGSGVRDIFVPGGDAASPAGEFSCAAELLKALATLPDASPHVGIAAHPQGHPEIPDTTLTEALQTKQQYADYAVAQISNESGKELDAWIERMREHGVTLPIYISVIGCVERRRLLLAAKNFSFKNLTWFARKNPRLVLSFLPHKVYRPDTTVAGILRSRLISGIHLNTFNNVTNTEEWRQTFLNTVLR